MRDAGTRPLETERLLLRRARLDDAPAMFRNWASDPLVTEYLTWPTYGSEKGAERFIADQLARYQDEQHYNWFIELKGLGEVIGSIGFVRRCEDVGSFEVGYVVGRRWWGQGIATEALSVVIGFAFEELGANRVEAQHDVENPSSGRVMEKCGMTCEGTLRQAARNNRGVVDVRLYSILASEYSL